MKWWKVGLPKIEMIKPDEDDSITIGIGPLESMDFAIDEIIDQYEIELGRGPTQPELNTIFKTCTKNLNLVE